MKIKGIDVSYHQGIINWNKVKQAGIEFAIIRIGYGKYDFQKDKQFENNYKNAKSNGIKVGVYHYSYAVNVDEAKKEADLVIKWLDDRQLDLPVYFDIEDKSQASLSTNLRTEMAKSFCEKIENAGYWVGIYANKNWLETKLDMNYLKDYTVWLAQWTNTPTYKGSYAMWQYTSNGTVDGIGGRVDMNYQVKELGGKIGTTSSSNKKSNEEVAGEVIKGIWGNGQERKNRLTNSGYDYNAIQNIVNQKLSKKSNEEVANEVIKGKWGNGAERKKRLEETGYNYKEIQKIVNERLK